jgi:hypothetical protein
MSSRFSRPVSSSSTLAYWPEEYQHRALLDAERHVIQRQRAAEPLRHALNFDRGIQSWPRITTTGQCA